MKNKTNTTPIKGTIVQTILKSLRDSFEIIRMVDKRDNGGFFNVVDSKENPVGIDVEGVQANKLIEAFLSQALRQAYEDGYNECRQFFETEKNILIADMENKANFMDSTSIKPEENK